MDWIGLNWIGLDWVEILEKNDGLDWIGLGQKSHISKFLQCIPEIITLIVYFVTGMLSLALVLGCP